MGAGHGKAQDYPESCFCPKTSEQTSWGLASSSGETDTKSAKNLIDLRRIFNRKNRRNSAQKATLAVPESDGSTVAEKAVVVSVKTAQKTPKESKKAAQVQLKIPQENGHAKNEVQPHPALQMEDPAALNFNQATVSKTTATSYQPIPPCGWRDIFKRKDAAVSVSNHTPKHSSSGNKKIIRERFDCRVTAKYEIKALIGKGSFSRVVRAENRASQVCYAIKLLPAKNGTGPFENELAILNRVHHPNLIQLQETFRASNRVYMVLELANGGELYDRIISKGSFTELESARALKMLLSGLQYLHRMGITHRDLKPENILYQSHDEDSRLMITDFGLAHQSDACAATGQEQSILMSETCGTPEYISPEILLRLPYNNKVDIWALGVVAYILFSGIMPFDSESRSRLYRQIIRGRYHFYPEFWRNVSEGAKTFVQGLLQTEPDERMSADEALRHPWLLTSLLPPLHEVPKAYMNHHSNIQRSFSTKTEPLMRGPYQHPPRAHQDIHKTRSNRSIRSVARSDHGHRVRPKEVEKLSKDPEIRRIIYARTHSRGLMDSNLKKDYGMI